MAMRYLSFTRRNPVDLSWFTPSASTRSFQGFFSTAAKQHGDGGDCNGANGDDDSVSHIRMLEMKTRKLEEQVNDLTMKYNQALVDSQSIIRRTQKFVEDAKLFGIQSFCRDIVEVADLVEKGSTIEEKDGAQELSQCLANIQGRLQEVFTKHGLKKMTPIGSKSDPYQHQVVCHGPANGVELGTIALVKREGYTLHGRTIRHAHVGIAVKTREE